MNNFEFLNPVKLIFGKGTIAKLSENLYKGEKIMLTYGGGSIKRTGIYDQVIKALDGFSFVEFGGIEANPDYDTLMKAVEICRNEGVGMLLAVGGGSVIDGTKFIAAAVDYKGDPWDILLDPSKIGDTLPIATVLTIPATGSEMNPSAVISRRRTKEKLAFGHPKVYPVFSILDPQCIYTLPAKQKANGLVDSFIHVMEQYMTDNEPTFVQSRWAEGLLSTIMQLAPSIMQEKTDYDSCANFMYAATCALNGYIAMGVNEDWSTHMIGHELTAIHGLDHGVTLAIVFPGTLSVMRQEKKGKLLSYAKNVLGISAGANDDRIDKAIEKTEQFFNSLGVKTRLSDYGIGQDTINEIVSRFEKRGWNLGEHGIVTPEKARLILESRL